MSATGIECKGGSITLDGGSISVQSSRGNGSEILFQCDGTSRISSSNGTLNVGGNIITPPKDGTWYVTSDHVVHRGIPPIRVDWTNAFLGLAVIVTLGVVVYEIVRK